ncbi:MAG: ApaG domain [Alphaproteobacteria bacterium]|nr:ApaG domain [Alphaproteobacteria bacterium]
MLEFENFDYVTAQTGDIMVSAFQEKLDEADDNHALWGYCLRIENNSDQKIRLLKKDFCVANDKGDRKYDLSFGFHGEIPDLEPGEIFEYEDTAFIEGNAAVLYGSCVAATADGTEFSVKLPIVPLNSLCNHPILPQKSVH